MKKQYLIRKRLIEATRHGYDASTGTFNWPNERWENYVKVSEVVNFIFSSSFYII